MVVLWAKEVIEPCLADVFIGHQQLGITEGYQVIQDRFRVYFLWDKLSHTYTKIHCATRRIKQ